MRKNYLLTPFICFLFLFPPFLSAQCPATNTAEFEACLDGGATSIEIPRRNPMPYIFAVTDVDLRGVSIELNNAILILQGNILVDADTRFFGSGNAMIIVIADDGSVFTATGNSGNSSNTSFAELNDILASGNFPTLLEAIMFASGALPVNLTSFTGRVTDAGVVLRWTTASETNNDHFEVQHSLDGRNYSILETVPGRGTTNQSQDYSYLHQNPAGGLHYYRLRQVDFDGAFEIHQVITVHYAGGSHRPVTVFPNPAVDFLQVRWASADDSRTTLHLLDATGRLLRQYVIDDQSPTYELSVAGLPPGLYVLQLRVADQVETVRFQKK